jgi:hypothetical protein
MIQIANATNRGDEPTKSAGKCGQIYGGRAPNNDPHKGTQRCPQYIDIKGLFIRDFFAPKIDRQPSAMACPY